MYPNGDTASSVFQWDTNSYGWIPEYKQTNYYDPSGADTLSVIHRFDTASESWKLNVNVVTSFIDTEKDTLSRFFYYLNDQDSLEIALTIDYVFSYDEEDRINTLFCDWDGYPELDSFVYDIQGNRIAEYYSEWNDSAWFYTYSTINHYNEENNLDTIYYFEWDENSSSWLTDGMLVLYYPPVITPPQNSAIDSKNYEELSVYPNPATDKIEFNGVSGTACIYNAQGIKMLEKLLPENDTELSIGELPSGLYFFSIQDKDKSWTGRFLKQ
jgi:hypothetical protein